MSKPQFKRAQCAECTGSFDLIPPADPEYSEPKLKATSEDNLPRYYECDGEGHRNTVYWQKREGTAFFFKPTSDF